MTAMDFNRVHDYALGALNNPDRALKALERRTLRSARRPRMLSGPLVANTLATLVAALGARRVLEVGTFTGYTARAMARALPAAGRLITLDVDPEYGRWARRAWDRAGEGNKIRQVLGHALNTLPGIKGPFDFCFIDADKLNYPEYFELCLERARPGGIVALDNTHWGGSMGGAGSSDGLRTWGRCGPRCRLGHAPSAPRTVAWACRRPRTARCAGGSRCPSPADRSSAA